MFRESTALRHCLVQANESVKEVHDRMPLILEEEGAKEWL